MKNAFTTLLYNICFACAEARILALLKQRKGARRLPFMFRDYLKIRLLYCYLLQSVAIAYCEETVLGFQQFDRQFIEGVFQHL